MANLLLPVLLLGVMYFFLIVPQKKKQKAQANLMSSLGPGDEVVTTGGIYGGVTEVDGDSVYLEIAPDIEIKIARRAIAERVYSAKNPAPAPAEVPAGGITGGIAGKLSSMFGGGGARAVAAGASVDAPADDAPADDAPADDAPADDAPADDAPADELAGGDDATDEPAVGDDAAQVADKGKS